MTKTICIYHGNCADGFGAAWAVRHALGDADVEYFPGVYQEEPPDVTGRDVILVDFSYKRPVLEGMMAKANTVLILDHHKTAAEELDGFPRPRENWDMHTAYAGAPGCSHVGVLFDMERSGAMMAWDYFHPGKKPPQLLRHIQDRDLWRFELEGTREIQAAVFSYPYDFEIWDMMLNPTFGGEGQMIESLFNAGEAIERKHFKDIDELVDVTMRRMDIGGYNVPVANLPYTLASDAGHKMAEGEPFAACYWDTPGGRVFSLRSTDDGLDVSEIAKKYGGGGHRSAAGFRVPLPDES